MQNIHISEDELPVGIYKTTIEGKIIYANNTFLKLLGFTNIKELEKINVNSLFVNPEIRQNQIDFWQENIIQSSEFELFTKDRKKITVIDNGYKTFDKDGNMFFVGSLMDITEKKIAENKLLEKETKFRELFDFAVDGILLMNNNGEITNANKVFLQLFEKELDNIVNQKADCLFTKEEIEREPLRYYDLNINESRTFIRQIFKKDKTKIWIEIHTKRMSDGSFQSFFHNINDRIIAERALDEYKEKLITILDSVEAGIFVVDEETHLITDVNRYAAQLIGLNKTEIEGEVCHKFICPAERGNCPISDLKLNIDKSERILICNNGNYLPVLKTITPIYLKNKKHLLEVFIDITEQKKH